MSPLRRRPGDDLAGRIVWILGSPRSGSTWLARLLTAHPGAAPIGEPLIGMHLAPFMPAAFDPEPRTYPELNGDRPDYFFAGPAREAWGPPLRELILARFASEDVGREQLAIVKEPHGSQGAEMLLELIPESHLLFLLRDGRDVVDSELAAFEPSAWLGRGFDVQVPRLQLLEYLARTWLMRTEAVERAFAAHDPERRQRVRYEDLLADTEGQLAAIEERLGLAADAARLSRTVAELDFAKLGETGPDHFHRSATPGAWRENLAADEQERLTELLGPKLAELGYTES